MIFLHKNIRSVLTSPYFLLLLFAILAYWQIAFLANSIQNDMLDCHLPWRYFISDTIQSGEFPLWNPYQQLGYPIHADLRSVWNPFVLFISLFTIYTNYTLHFFLILYLFLAGIGMYKLMMHFTECKKTSLLIGIAYILSGYFISHTQEISAFAGAAFVPFILLYYLKFLTNYRYIDILKTSIFLFLMLSCAYPALTIILIYLLGGIFLFYSIPIILKWEKKLLIKIFISHFALSIIMLILSTVFIITIIQVGPFVGRITELSLLNAQYGAFTPQSAISFLLPFASVADSEFINTDITMSNAYFGIVMLIIFIASLIKKRSMLEYFLLAFGVISLLASFGEFTPVREILYNYFPLMDKFRFPSFFTLFSTLLFLIFTGIFLSRLEKNKRYNYKTFLFLAVAVLGLIIYAIAYSLSELNLSDITFFNSDISFWEKIKVSTLFEHIFIQGIIQFVVVLAFIFYLLKTKALKIKFVFWIVVIEMIIAVQLNMYYTGTSEAKPDNINNYISTCQKGFIIPENSLISENTAKESSFWPLWRNTTNFTKKVSFDSFNSFVLVGYETLIDSFPKLKNEILKNQILYFSDKILPYSSISKTKIKHNNIHTHDTIYKRYKGLYLNSDESDKIKIVKFSPNGLIAKTKTKSQQIITLLQSNYSGWEVYIDNIKVPHFTSNFLTISTILPKGNHEVEFKYKNKKVLTGFVISFTFFGILIFVLTLFYIVKSKKYRNVYLVGISLLILIIVYKIIYISNKKTYVQQVANNALFYSNNNFETKYELWKIDTNLLSKFDNNTTNVVYKIDSLSEFCSTFIGQIGQLCSAKIIDISVKVKTYFETEINSVLVLSIERADSVIFWKSSPINNIIYQKKTWNEPSIYIKNISVQAEDIIKTYIWNKEKNKFLIDDFKIEIFESKRHRL